MGRIIFLRKKTENIQILFKCWYHNFSEGSYTVDVLEIVPLVIEDSCQKSPICLRHKTHYIWYHSNSETPYAVDVLEISTVQVTIKSFLFYFTYRWSTSRSQSKKSISAKETGRSPNTNTTRKPSVVYWMFSGD